MSRIGRKPIPVPAGVKIALQSGKVDVQGRPLPPSEIARQYAAAAGAGAGAKGTGAPAPRR